MYNQRVNEHTPVSDRPWRRKDFALPRGVTVQEVRDAACGRSAKALLEQELTSATGKIARQCLACAHANVPDDVVILRWRKKLTGRALHKADVAAIEAPLPKTRKALYVFLHECGHLHLHRRTSKSRHRREYEAEVYAHCRMQEAGIEVPESMTENARRYIAWKIRQAVRRGARRLDQDACDFARVSYR